MDLRRILLTILLLGVVLPAVAYAGDSGSDEEQDFWTGKKRPEIVTMLGEPTKAKTSEDGSETLTYRFVRIRDGSVPSPDLEVMSLPGVGLVGRTLDRHGSDLRVDSSGLDGDGNLLPGGPSTSRSAGSSWNKDDGWQTDGGETGTAASGKVKLKLQLGRDGRVESWTISPKPKKQSKG